MSLGAEIFYGILEALFPYGIGAALMYAFMTCKSKTYADKFSEDL